MKEVKDMEYFSPAEKLVEVLMEKTQNENPLFFRVLVAYYLSKVASMMRVGIKTHDRGVIPVSLYALNLATSGSGKGFSTNIVEEQVIDQFKLRFMEETFPKASEINLAKLAIKRAHRDDIDDEDAIAKVNKEFEEAGELAFSFDSATTAAVKQMRHKLLMANAGSVNLEIDEIGSNLLGNTEVLSTFLELYDVGKVKQKLTKNTSENKRASEIDGRTPTNMMLFGTPFKLLDGGKVEEEFYSMLETGYARRCLFGYNKDNTVDINLTPEQVYDKMTRKVSANYLKEMSNKLGNLADPSNFGINLLMSKDVTLLLIEYKLACLKMASEMREHEEIAKAEVSHRYFKTLKLAGAYAFYDGSHEITEDHLYNAIKLVEESGRAFRQILKRERNYVKLANYIANVGHEVTDVDLLEDLAFYRGNSAQKKDMMSLAIAYGYKHNIIIKKSYSDGIEFLKGEALETTDLNKLPISYSKELAYNYQADYAPFNELHKLVCLPDFNYTTHHFIDGHRNSANLLQGFNMVVLDVDSGVNLATAKQLLSEYTCLFATTKSHTKEINRFRIIMPLTHKVKLTPEMHSKFMDNVFNWLPFSVDTSAKDSARKWATHAGDHYYQEGKLLDATLFIPETKKEEEQSKQILDMSSLTNLERWFCLNTQSGNRSNQLYKYAMILVDNGQNVDSIKNALITFNGKLKDGLQEDEINNTIMVSVIKAVTKRDLTI